MALPKKNVQKITRIYNKYGGVDYTGTNESLGRHISVNMWKNYSKDNPQNVSVRPPLIFKSGIKKIVKTKEGNYLFEDNNLYFEEGQTKTLVYNGLGVDPKHFFFKDKMYIIDGVEYISVTGTTAKVVEGTIPITSINRNALGGGESFQKVNILTPWRKNTFKTDGESTEYFLDTKAIDQDLVTGELDGVAISEPLDFTVDRAKGSITFATAPVVDIDLVIKFKKHIQGHRERLKFCTIFREFDNRMFFSGNPDYPNAVFHTELEDAEYIGDTNYYEDGSKKSAIVSMVNGNNNLWVIKEDNENGSNLFKHSPTIDYEYGKIYPSSQSNIKMKALGSAINFNDDILFLSENGVEAIKENINTEEVTYHRSTLIDALLLDNKEATYEMAQMGNYLLILKNNGTDKESEIFLGDFYQRSGIETSNFNYEWYYWKTRPGISGFNGENFYFKGKNNNYFIASLFNEEEWGKSLEQLKEEGIEDIEEVVGTFQTPRDNFGEVGKLKNLSKRGGMLKLNKPTKNIELYVITDGIKKEGIRIFPEGEYNNFKLKEKKFIDIAFQLIGEEFTLDELRFEVIAGGYAKNKGKSERLS